MTKNEMLAAIMLLERLANLRHMWIEDQASDPFQEMSLYLMKRHLAGQVTTPTSLARAATLPYTTATRRVAQMKQQGLLDYRVRTTTGRSYSVHPSTKLIARMTSYLMSVQAAMSDGPKARRGVDATQARVINAPCIARQTLGFGGGLRILVLKDPAYAFGKPLRRELNFLMGGKVAFHETTIDELRGRILENAAKSQSDYDVIAVDLPTIAEFAHLGALLPLEDIGAESHLNSGDFVSAAWQGTIVDRAQYAMPILINPQLLFYRQDLLSKAGRAPPETTQDVLEIAKQFHKPAQGRYGISWCAARGAPVGQAFVQFLADFGQPVVEMERAIGGYKPPLDGGRGVRPLIDTEAGRAAAAFMLELLEVSTPDAMTLGWDGQISWLRKGRVAMAYEWANRASQLVGVQEAGALGYLSHPVGAMPNDSVPRSPIAPMGGFAFGIPSNIAPAKRKTAWNAIEWMSSPEVIKLQVQYGGCVSPRRSVAADLDVRQISPMTAAVDAMDQRGEICLWPRPAVAQYTDIVRIMGEEMHDMLAGEQSIATALRRAQVRAEKLTSG